MQDYQEHNSLPLPREEFFSNPSEDPEQICHALKIQLLSLITDIEELRGNESLADNLEFLDAIATHIVTLNSLSSASMHICSAPTAETGKLLNNVLTCNVLVKNRDFSLSILDAAKIYRKNRKNKEPLCSLVKVYSEEKAPTQCLLTELKLLAFDLNEEMENI